MRGFAFVQLPPLLAAKLAVIDRAEDVEGPLYTADLVQGLVHAVLAGVRAEPMQGSRSKRCCRRIQLPTSVAAVPAL